MIWQIILNKTATLTEIEGMTLDRMADALEAVMVADDVQQWHHAHGGPDG